MKAERCALKVDQRAFAQNLNAGVLKQVELGQKLPIGFVMEWTCRLTTNELQLLQIASLEVAL